MISAESIAQLLTPLSSTRWPESSTGRQAAVLVPLILEKGGGLILYTQRSKHLAEHAGQIAFPGGVREAQDASPAATALRETFEEIGIRPETIQLLGSLAPIRTSTGYSLVPLAGLIPWPVELRLDPSEVDSTFAIPWSWFFGSGKLVAHDGCPTSISLHYPVYEGHEVWGATAMITMDLVEKLRTAAED
jgi:8-oxo-dGTP pyrophosphatase MutT (NUDIX family)